MRNAVGILILILVVGAILEFYHRYNERDFDKKILKLETKIVSLNTKVDSLQAVIKKGRTKLERSRIKGKPAVAEDIISDVEEYLNSTKLAKGYEKRGREVTAKEYSATAEKYKIEVMKLFSKDSVIDLELDTGKGFSYEYMFTEEKWKLITKYYNSLRSENKPKEWITDDKILKVLENLEENKKYKVKFKVLETIHMPYSGSVSYFSLHLKCLDIIPL